MLFHWDLSGSLTLKLDIDTLVFLFVVTVIEYSISTRVLRIDPEISLSRIRDEIARQVRFTSAFTFLRHVGRALVVVSKKQEIEMKGKHYLPPHSTTYEILILPGAEHLYIRGATGSQYRSHDYNRNSYQPVQQREKTFDAVRRIISRLVNDRFISDEFGDQLIDEAARDPQFGQAIKLLDENGLLEDVMKFFETDEERLEFLRWMANQSNLDRYIKRMTEDPFLTIKDYYIQKGTFVDNEDTEQDTEEVRNIKDKR